MLGLAGIKADARFSSNQLRVANRDALTTLLETVLAGWSQGELLAALEAATVPAGPINTVGQAFEDPQLQHRGMQISPEGIPGVRGPWKFSDAELALEKSAPKLPK